MASPERQVLLEVADGPEGILIYTDEDRGVVDWAESFPALYCTVAVNGAWVRLGPFQLHSIYEQLVERLGDPALRKEAGQ